MVKIAHVSDLHLTGSSEHDDQVIRRLRDRLKEAGDVNGKPDFLVVSGDIVDGPCWRKKNHALLLRSCLQRLRTLCSLLSANDPSRLRVAPGNHDLKSMGMVTRAFTLDEFDDVFSDHLGFHADAALKVVFASFNTNLRTPAIETATGTASVAELSEFETWLEGQGDVVRRFPRVAVLHHHPMPVAESEAQARSIVDPADYLRLRNAGTLLKRLIQSGFHLVLHGHLHAPEHWSVSTSFGMPTSSSSARPIEIIGAGSGGKPEHGGKYSFNVVTVHDLGWVQASEYDFADHGGNSQPIPLVHRTFDFVRPTIGAIAHELAELPFKCKAVDIDVRVHPRSGLMESDTKYFRIRSRTDQGHDAFPVELKFDSVLNRPAVAARSLDTGVSLNVAQRGQAHASGLSNFVYSVDLREIGSLVDAQDIAYTVRASGGVFGTAQHAHWFFGDAKAIATESFSFKVRFKQDLLHVSIHFVESAPELIPTHFRVRVFDSDDREVACESASTEVALIAHRPWSNGDGPCRRRGAGPDASLFVHRPIAGFTYTVVWDLPDRFDKDHEPGNGLRGIILRPKPSGRKDLRPLVEGFLVRVADLLRSMTAASEGKQEEFDCYLYGIDAADGESRMVHSLNSGGPSLPAAVGWGKSLIGECVRYRRSILWMKPLSSRTDPGATQTGPALGREQGIPSSTITLCAFPIWPKRYESEAESADLAARVAPLPACVVAAVSYSTENTVIKFLKKPAKQREFVAGVTVLLDELQATLKVKMA